LSKEGNFDLKNILIKIKQFGYSRILVESGLTLTTNFLKNNLVDDLHLFISNNNLGNLGKNSMKKNVKFFLSKKKNTNEVVNLMGDKLISYKIK
jgi:riboflavin biosynthesis pyrimidine reductase